MHRGIDINPFTMSKTRGKPRYRPDAGFRFSSWSRLGGASRDRTDDLKLAKLALSQLSYGPEGPKRKGMVGLRGFEPLTSPLSGVRSNQLSYRPVPRPAGRQFSRIRLPRAA